MNIAEYMKKHNLNEADLNVMATPYETGDWEPAEAPIYSGSHLAAMGNSRWGQTSDLDYCRHLLIDGSPEVNFNLRCLDADNE